MREHAPSSLCENENVKRRPREHSPPPGGLERKEGACRTAG
jgi:hypothetical protein